MLGKLIKYEFKATYKTFLSLIIAYIVISGLLRLVMFNTSDFIVITIITALISIAFQGISMVVSIYPIILSIGRFRKNLLGDEGYLMNTLPVRTSSLIFSKFIASVVWFIVSFAVSLVSGYIVMSGQDSLSNVLSQLDKFIKDFAPYLYSPQFIALAIAFIIASSMYAIFMFYASVAIGHLSSANKKLFGFLAFMGIFIVNIVLIGICVDSMSKTWTNTSDENIVYLILGFFTVYSIVFAAIYYYITSTILKRRLNLE